MALALLEQAVAAAQGALELVDAGAVIGVDGEHQPIEEAPPLARRIGEQSVHRRRQPDDTQMVGEGARRGDAHAIDAIDARRRFRRWLQPGPKLARLAIVLDLDRHCKAARAAVARAFAELRAPQSAARRE